MAQPEHEEEWEVRVQTCRIDLWRGYVTSNFTARLVDGPDVGTVVDASSSFRWRRSDPPDTQEAKLAHYELVSRLKADGWAPAAEGVEWYANELARPTLVPVHEEPPVESPAELEAAPPPQVVSVTLPVPPEPEIRERAPEPEPLPAEEPDSPPRRGRDRWHIAAIVGLALAIAFLVVLATHG